eukprot:Opistho-2@44102
MRLVPSRTAVDTTSIDVPFASTASHHALWASDVSSLACMKCALNAVSTAERECSQDVFVSSVLATVAATCPSAADSCASMQDAMCEYTAATFSSRQSRSVEIVDVVSVMTACIAENSSFVCADDADIADTASPSASMCVFSRRASVACICSTAAFVAAAYSACLPAIREENSSRRASTLTCVAATSADDFSTIPATCARCLIVCSATSFSPARMARRDASAISADLLRYDSAAEAMPSTSAEAISAEMEPRAEKRLDFIACICSASTRLCAFAASRRDAIAARSDSSRSTTATLSAFAAAVIAMPLLLALAERASKFAVISATAAAWLDEKAHVMSPSAVAEAQRSSRSCDAESAFALSTEDLR